MSTEPTRRSFLRTAALGAAATAWTPGNRYLQLVRAAQLGQAYPLAPRPGHHPAQADQLIMVFLTGGFSHVDTFDPKPRLTQLEGQKLGPGFALGSPFRFRRSGQSGLPISELFTELARHADDLCVLRTLHTDIVEHFQATLAMHTGSATLPMPSLGSWLSYALGTRHPNLPSFVVLAEHLPYAGAQVWSNNFLPPHHQGVRLLPGDRPVANLEPPVTSLTRQALERLMLDRLHAEYAQARPDDLEPLARSDTFRVARGLMREAPEVFDLSQESSGTLAAYGVELSQKSAFAAQCLLARRLIERGVRVVELIDTGSHDNWDAHGDMQQHRGKAARVDRALAALVGDLKQRGLFDRTLVMIATEFGRTPWCSQVGARGREHHAAAFSCLLAGAGVRGGMAYGSTDELGVAIAENPVHVHDYHATILHLMGLDHQRLTYRYAGRDFRLTDVSGRVLREVLLNPSERQA